MRVHDAIRRGYRRIRKPQWALATDYVKIVGAQGHLYSELQLRGAPEPTYERPQKFLIITDKDDDWEQYTGPLPEDDRDDSV